MTVTDLPEKLRALADTLVGDEWEHPIDAVETCRKAADEIERLTRERDAASGVIAEKLHLRRCQDCGCEFYVQNGAVPYCRCGSWNAERINTGKDRLDHD